MTGKPIFDIRLAGALFAKINSNVPTYADEFIFTKSELISRPLLAFFFSVVFPTEICRLKTVYRHTLFREALFIFSHNVAFKL